MITAGELYGDVWCFVSSFSCLAECEAPETFCRLQNFPTVDLVDFHFWVNFSFKVKATLPDHKQSVSSSCWCDTWHHIFKLIPKKVFWNREQDAVVCRCVIVTSECVRNRKHFVFSSAGTSPNVPPFTSVVKKSFYWAERRRAEQTQWAGCRCSGGGNLLHNRHKRQSRREESSSPLKDPLVYFYLHSTCFNWSSDVSSWDWRVLEMYFCD